MYREKQILVGFWTTDSTSTKRGNKTNNDPIIYTNSISNTTFVAGSSTKADEGYPVLVGSAEPQPVLAPLTVTAAANEEPHSGDQPLLSAAVPHLSDQDHEEAVRPIVDLNQPYCDPAAQRCGAPVLPAGQARPCLDHGGSGACAKCKTKNTS